MIKGSTLTAKPICGLDDSSSARYMCGIICHSDTVNSEKIALVWFLLFIAFSLGRKIEIRND